MLNISPASFFLNTHAGVKIGLIAVEWIILCTICDKKGNKLLHSLNYKV